MESHLWQWMGLDHVQKKMISQRCCASDLWQRCSSYPLVSPRGSSFIQTWAGCEHPCYRLPSFQPPLPRCFIRFTHKSGLVLTKWVSLCTKAHLCECKTLIVPPSCLNGGLVAWDGQSWFEESRWNITVDEWAHQRSQHHPLCGGQTSNEMGLHAAIYSHLWYLCHPEPGMALQSQSSGLVVCGNVLMKHGTTVDVFPQENPEARSGSGRIYASSCSLIVLVMCAASNWNKLQPLGKDFLEFAVMCSASLTNPIRSEVNNCLSSICRGVQNTVGVAKSSFTESYLLCQVVMSRTSPSLSININGRIHWLAHPASHWLFSEGRCGTTLPDAGLRNSLGEVIKG